MTTFVRRCCDTEPKVCFSLHFSITQLVEVVIYELRPFLEIKRDCVGLFGWEGKYLPHFFPVYVKCISYLFQIVVSRVKNSKNLEIEVDMRFMLCARLLEDC